MTVKLNKPLKLMTVKTNSRLIGKQLQKKELDFFAASVTKTYDRRRANRNAFVFLIFFLSVVAIAYPTVTTKINNANLIEEINTVQANLTSSTYQELEDITAKTQQISLLSQYTTAVNSASAEFNSLPKFSTEVLDVINKALPEDVTILSVNYTDGIVELNCQSANIDSPPQTAVNLLSTDSFEKVSYTGLTNADSGYTFTLQCEMKEATSN